MACLRNRVERSASDPICKVRGFYHPHASAQDANVIADNSNPREKPSRNSAPDGYLVATYLRATCFVVEEKRTRSGPAGIAFLLITRSSIFAILHDSHILSPLFCT